MKKILIILVLVCFLNNTYAQKTLTFKDTFIVIRKVNNDTTIHHQFTFKNNGKLPLSIKSWKALNDGIECKYSKENITPNSSGFLYFIFSIKRKYSNAFSKKIELTFSNGAKQELEIIYCADNDYVFGKIVHDFGYITQGETVKHTFKLKNISKDTISILNNEVEDNMLTNFTKKPILPNESFDFTIFFNSSGKQSSQGRSKKINFSNGASIECGFAVYVVSEFLYKFDSIVSGMETHDFNTIEEGSKVKFNYIFKNTSNETLYIVNISTSCGCHVCQYSKEAILPNQYFIVGNYFDASGKYGQQTKTANMTISNRNNYNNTIYFTLTASVIPRKEKEINPKPLIKN